MTKTTGFGTGYPRVYRQYDTLQKISCFERIGSTIDSVHDRAQLP